VEETRALDKPLPFSSERLVVVRRTMQAPLLVLLVSCFFLFYPSSAFLSLSIIRSHTLSSLPAQYPNSLMSATSIAGLEA
jgi:hypothetical protein